MTTQTASALATRLAESVTDRWSLSTTNRYGEEYFPSLEEVAEAMIFHLKSILQVMNSRARTSARCPLLRG